MLKTLWPTFRVADNHAWISGTSAATLLSMAEGTQRRLAAIVSADVVGYSRLMGVDETGTLAALRAHRAELIDAKIDEHGGRIVKTMGDGLLLEFPSVVEATQCVIEIQAGMVERNHGIAEDQRIIFRIGVNIGDIIIEGEDILGDGVNIAARLQEIAEPGGVAISGRVHDDVRDRLRVSFIDTGEQVLKNIVRPMRIWQWLPAASTAASPAMGGQSLPLPDKPSIAVLPFENMSGDPEQEYFADGITEDIITELSRFRSLFVIARNSSFVFKGRNVDLSEVGRKLGVQYVVEGSVRKAGDRVRVTAQLIDAATSHHLWAERYDRELKDIFAVQDEIAQTIVSTLPGRLEEADRERAERKRTANMTAYDYLLLGHEQFNSFMWERIAEARDLAQRAIEIDPRYARAHALMAGTHLWELPVGYSNELTLEKALTSAENAIVLDDEDSWSHAMFAMALFENGQDVEAEIQGRRAVALNSNDADANAMLGVILVYCGCAEEGREWIDKAMRLNPFPPGWYHWYSALAFFSLHDYEKTIHAFKEIRSLDRWGHAYLAACHARLNQMNEARSEIAIFINARRQELMEQGEPFPSNTIELARVRANRYRTQGDRDHLLESLQMSGLTDIPH